MTVHLPEDANKVAHCSGELLLLGAQFTPLPIIGQLRLYGRAQSNGLEHLTVLGIVLLHILVPNIQTKGSTISISRLPYTRATALHLPECHVGVHLVQVIQVVVKFVHNLTRVLRHFCGNQAQLRGHFPRLVASPACLLNLLLLVKANLCRDKLVYRLFQMHQVCAVA